MPLEGNHPVWREGGCALRKGGLAGEALDRSWLIFDRFSSLVSAKTIAEQGILKTAEFLLKFPGFCFILELLQKVSVSRSTIRGLVCALGVFLVFRGSLVVICNKKTRGGVCDVCSVFNPRYVSVFCVFGRASVRVNT